MADVVAHQIARAVLSVLESIPAVNEVLLAPPGEPADFPALHLDDEGETVTGQDWNRVRAQLRLAVTGFVQGDGAEALRAARNLDGAVLAALMADEQLGGLATKIDVSDLAVEAAELADTRTVVFRRILSVDFGFLATQPDQVG